METFAYLYCSLMSESANEAVLSGMPDAPPPESGGLLLKPRSWNLRTLLLGATLTLYLLSVAHQALALKRGDRGAAVTSLQTRLRDRGVYSGPINGNFGPLTEAAVRKFQANQKLTVDGIAGSKTLQLLQAKPTASTSATTSTSTNTTTAASSSLKRGDRGASVTALQTRLRDRGFYSGPITGNFGPLTEAAVRKFQETRKLTVDGIAGQGTFAALNSTTTSPTSTTTTTTSSSSGVGGPATTVSRTTTTTTTSSTTTATTLKLDDQGPAVEALQTRLRDLKYYNGPITGLYGLMTQEAVQKFQADQKLPVDGIAGATTLARLTLSTTPATATTTTSTPATPAVGGPAVSAQTTAPGSLQLGSSGPAVEALQTRLREVGFFDGPISGIYGMLTEAAVRRFQSANGLPSDGIAGASTIQKLQSVVPNRSTAPITNSLAVVPQVGQASVLELQQRLKARGFYPGPLDGRLGPETLAAITQAQRFYGLNGRDLQTSQAL